MVLHENKQEPMAEGGMIQPQPGDIWQWTGQHKNDAPAIVNILLLKEVHDMIAVGLTFIGHCFDTGESREWYFTKNNMNRWQKVA